MYLNEHAKRQNEEIDTHFDDSHESGIRPK